MNKKQFLRLESINKRFGGVHALKDVSLTVEEGTVHALVGENGAGKSTLGKIIAGVYQPDSGKIYVENCCVRYHSPKEALADGIALISQEVALVPQLTVIENVFLGIENNRRGLIRNKEIRKCYDELVKRTEISIPPDIPVYSLRIAEQKKVEILRAIARNARLIIMDEPTAMLSAEEVKKLFALIRKLKCSGTTFIYVSHFLEEILSLADNVTVMRDGQCVKTSRVENESRETLIEAMLGRYVSLGFPEKIYPEPDAPVALSVEKLSRKGIFYDISFQIRKGEILGLAGLVGSGRTEIARCIFGADPKTEGNIKVFNKIVNPTSPKEAIDAGIALLPESRKLQGLILKLPVVYNISLPHLGKVSSGPFITLRNEHNRVKELLSTLNVKPLNPWIEARALSGGNQQKVLFAKWLFQKPKILIADEPTAGVDVGAKHAIYQLIHSLACEGIAILLISSDLEELIGLSHRIITINRGRITGEFSGSDLAEDKIMHAIFSTAS